MSNITTVYNSLISGFTALYPAKTRMHNPYDLDNNPDICKKDSWGLKVGSASQLTEEFCHLSIARQFTLVLMRQFITLSSKEDGFDAVSVSLLEAQQSAAGLLFSPTELGVALIIDIINISDISGVQELTSGEKKYLFSEVTFNITISELIS